MRKSGHDGRKAGPPRRVAPLGNRSTRSKPEVVCLVPEYGAVTHMFMRSGMVARHAARSSLFEAPQSKKVEESGRRLQGTECT